MTENKTMQGTRRDSAHKLRRTKIRKVIHQLPNFQSPYNLLHSHTEIKILKHHLEEA